MLGYLNKPSSTAVIKHGAGWLYTVGYFDGNKYTYILDQMEYKIKDSAVIGIPHEQKAEVPHAYDVVSNEKEENEVTEDEIKEFVATMIILP
uniref:AMP-binding enzyme C-terminal domain-containing protein n=1 Tax=Panagrolaimus davidi TaxID=227884 RepID=A0A914R149_9BILA